MPSSKEFRAGLLGAHLSHSFSPRIHGEFADYSYRLIELSEPELAPFLQGREFDGLNVTIPYKQAVIPHLDALSDTARRIGAVNTVVRRADGTLFGHNTDYDGFCDTVRELGVPFAGKKVLILGSGGASRMAVCAAEDLGAREVVVISRNGENNYGNLSRHTDAEILVNATPVGMYPHNGDSPVSLDGFPALCAVLDLIYNPARTALLLEAQKRGIPCRNGLLMLVSQARRAAELFLHTAIADSEVARVTRAIERETENIILIGMPGCGKSTLGKLLAEKTGRRFTDCDTEIVAAAGMSIPDIFAAEGEEGFRRRETTALAELCRESGRVIATGGGVVTQPRNLPLMRQNGRIVFLDIPPEDLPTDGRPLSISRTPEALYRERLPLYRAAADLTLSITRDVEANLTLLTEALTT